MGHEASVINGVLMQEFGEFARSAPLPLWVTQKLHNDFEALGLYARIASAAAMDDPEGMRVTVSKRWADALFREDFVRPMEALLEIGAITQQAVYRSGKVRLQMETYPPVIRNELDGYRRPGGKLVTSFS